jgi:hypothetical protein
MISKVSYKIFLTAILAVSTFIGNSQIRTDGYYSGISVSKTGDTSFHIICFRSSGQWTDTTGSGVAPILISIPIEKSYERCTYNKNGSELTLTREPINLLQYEVSNCPCKYRARIEHDGIFLIDWRDNNKNKSNFKTKYLFVPF